MQSLAMNNRFGELNMEFPTRTETWARNGDLGSCHRNQGRVTAIHRNLKYIHPLRRDAELRERSLRPRHVLTNVIDGFLADRIPGS